MRLKKRFIVKVIYEYITTAVQCSTHLYNVERIQQVLLLCSKSTGTQWTMDKASTGVVRPGQSVGQEPW